MYTRWRMYLYWPLCWWFMATATPYQFVKSARRRTVANSSVSSTLASLRPPAENCLVLPVHSPDMKKLSTLLQTARLHVRDAGSSHLRVDLIVSSQDVHKFTRFERDFPDLRLSVRNLTALVSSIDGDMAAHELEQWRENSRKGKFRWQSMKKLYGAAFCPGPAALILDVDSLFLRDVDLSALSSTFLANPTVLYDACKFPWSVSRLREDLPPWSCFFSYFFLSLHNSGIPSNTLGILSRTPSRSKCSSSVDRRAGLG